MSEDAFNMSIRKFLKEVGVTSQRKIEETVRDGQIGGKKAESPHDADIGRHRPQPRRRQAKSNFRRQANDAIKATR